MGDSEWRIRGERNDTEVLGSKKKMPLFALCGGGTWGRTPRNPKLGESRDRGEKEGQQVVVNLGAMIPPHESVSFVRKMI